MASRLPCVQSSMGILLATLAQRTTEFRRMARLISAGALCDFQKQAMYLGSAGGVVGIAAAIAMSKFLRTAVVVTEGRRRRTVRESTSLLGEVWWPSVGGSRDAATWRSMGVALVLVSVTVAGSQGLERLINRLLRPDAEEWTWISDLILSAGLLVMTVFWARLRQARNTISSLDAQRLVLDTQLSIASDVQRALLPPIPEPLNGVHWYGAVEPAGRVGGDYFDFLALPDGKMVVILADISGKGVPAAIFLSNIRAIVHALVREISAPNELLARLSRDVLVDAGAGFYATCFVALVDPEKRTMTYSNAGHPPGILTGRLGVHSLRVGGPPVGLLEAASYEAETVSFGEGEMITLVSDGISEALDVSADALPLALAAEVSRASPCTPQAICAQLLGATRGSPGPRGVEDWSDDRAVVAFGLVSSADTHGTGHSFSSTPNRSAIR
jgi:Stage II sporulation protein E (SpoIIE)